MINFILWLIVGGLAGWLASKVMGTDAQQGILLNIIVGIIGAYIGGFLAGALFGIATDIFSITGFIIAVLGACILLFLLNLVTGRRRV